MNRYLFTETKDVTVVFDRKNHTSRLKNTTTEKQLTSKLKLKEVFEDEEYKIPA